MDKFTPGRLILIADNDNNFYSEEHKCLMYTSCAYIPEPAKSKGEA